MAIGLYDRRPLTVRTVPTAQPIMHHPFPRRRLISRAAESNERKGGGEKEDSGKAGHLWSRGGQGRPTLAMDNHAGRERARHRL